MFALLLAWDEFFYALLYTSDIRAKTLPVATVTSRRAAPLLWANLSRWRACLAAARAHRLLFAEITHRWPFSRKRQGVKHELMLGAPTIYVIGAVAVDMIMGPIAPWPLPGTETFVSHSEIRPGGPPAILPSPCKLWGFLTVSSAMWGSDVFGRWLTESFGDQAHQWNVAKGTDHHIRGRRTPRRRALVYNRTGKSGAPDCGWNYRSSSSQGLPWGYCIVHRSLPLSQTSHIIQCYL